MRDLPTPAVLARLKPNFKGGLYMVKPMEIGYRYIPRLGRYEVHNEGDPALWETEDEALAAAKRFHEACRAASA
jgi:hypothetical protein